MGVKLKSAVYEVAEVKSKTSAKMFKSLQVGDTVQFEVEIKKAGRNGGTYATYIKATNTSTKETTWKSFNQLPDILTKFVLHEV